MEHPSWEFPSNGNQGQDRRYYAWTFSYHASMGLCLLLSAFPWWTFTNSFSLWQMGEIPYERYAQGIWEFFSNQVGLKTKDMDVTLSCDTVFGVLDAARKYMVEEIDLIDCLLISWLNQKRSQGYCDSFLPRSVSKLDTLKSIFTAILDDCVFEGLENYRYYTVQPLQQQLSHSFGHLSPKVGMIKSPKIFLQSCALFCLITQKNLVPCKLDLVYQLVGGFKNIVYFHFYLRKILIFTNQTWVSREEDSHFDPFFTRFFQSSTTYK